MKRTFAAVFAAVRRRAAADNLTMTSNEKPKASESSRRLQRQMNIIGVTATVALVGSVAFFVSHFYRVDLSPAVADWGVTGDFFGGVLNPVFGMLTLVAVLATLRIQQEELELTRNEMEKSAEALNGQVELMARQSFENMLFQMLNLHHGVVDRLVFPLIGREHAPSGRDAIRQSWRSLAGYVGRADDGTGHRRSIVRVAFRRFMDDFGPATGHYFESLRALFRVVTDAEFSLRAKYIAIVVAQLSTDELYLLSYLALADESDELKMTIESYGVLERLPLKVDDHPAFAYDIPLYRSQAFGARASDVQSLYGKST